MKNLVILGSTGSIGVNALRVVKEMRGDFRVVGLSAYSNVDLLTRQVSEFKPEIVSVFDNGAAADFKSRVNGTVRHLPPGVEGLCEMASRKDVDLVLLSLVGGVGFAPFLAALKSGKTVALANKEPMVMAGAQFMIEAERWGAKILPVDSEPSAIFQCLETRPIPKGALGNNTRPREQNPRTAVPEECSRGRGQLSPKDVVGGGLRSYAGLVNRVFLTASGGAFYRRRGDLSKVTVEQALRHPTWKMGKKITTDCATLMNKGFETIEIMNLFGLALRQVQIVIHPQSILHSAVEFKDGSVLAQLGHPDMKLPIQYAMTWPARTKRVVEPLDLFKVKAMTFDKPDFRRFPCLALALEAAKTGGSMPAVLSAADEAAVSAFLDKKIRFTDIARVVEKTMKAHRCNSSLPSFAEVVEIDAWARQKSREIIEELS